MNASKPQLLHAPSECVRQLREAREWSQDTLAHLSGLHRAYPHKIETGQVDPRLSTLARPADVFGIGLAELLGGIVTETHEKQ